MEDDFSFASVWGAPSDPLSISSPLKQSILPPANDFPSSSSSSQGDFDDFGTAPTGTSDAQDDDFGDFGDFGEAEEMITPADFEDIGFGQEERIIAPTIPESEWEPLELDPMPSRVELQERLDEVLGPIWSDDISPYTTAEDIRQVEGVSQILVTPERYLQFQGHPNLSVHSCLFSRDLYNTIFHSPPPTKPPNWTRSRIRQQHLISLGIPVNLDEILPHSNGKPLPPLEITTRPMSAPPGARNPQQTKASVSVNISRPGTPISANRSGASTVSQLGLGPKPELDNAKINELLELDPGLLRSLFTKRLRPLNYIIQKHYHYYHSAHSSGIYMIYVHRP
jgi:Domain of unknown function (DUF5102)